MKRIQVNNFRLLRPTKKSIRFLSSFVSTLCISSTIGLLMMGCELKLSEGLFKRNKHADPEKVLPWKNKELQSKPEQKRETTETGKYGDFQQIFADVAEKVTPGVVSVYSERQVSTNLSPWDELLRNSPFHGFNRPPNGEGRNESRRESGLGSGVIISPMGFILTNNHVISGADVINVQLADGREMAATIVGSDSLSDIAVIKVKDKVSDLPVVELGDSDKLRIGEWVVAVGNPYGLSHTVTTGIISAKGRKTNLTFYENFLQTDAAINPGNSGGALVNLKGQLVGINTAILSRSGGYQGIGLAIPINMAKKITEDLIESGEVTRGWLGVQIQDLDQALAEALGLPNRQGALVNDVKRGSPAEKAGIKRGDVALEVNGKSVGDASDLMNQVALIRPGTSVQIKIQRGNKAMNVEVVLGKRNEDKVAEFGRQQNDQIEESEEWLGMDLVNLNPSLKKQYRLDPGLVSGILVQQVKPDSPADKAGLKEGDVIIEAKGERVTDISDLARDLKKMKGEDKLLLLINREGNTFFLALAK